MHIDLRLCKCYASSTYLWIYLLLFLSELEALGDDLALDEDTSYLDEVPAPSDTIPGEQDAAGAKTQVRNISASLSSLSYLISP